MIIKVIKLKRGTCHINLLKFYPGLAQFGRAPDLGSGGRGFKSRISDQPNEARYCYFITAYTNNFGVMPDRQGVVFSLPISRYSSVGRTLVWGTRGRRFKSCYFDHMGCSPIYNESSVAADKLVQAIKSRIGQYK